VHADLGNCCAVVYTWVHVYNLKHEVVDVHPGVVSCVTVAEVRMQECAPAPDLCRKYRCFAYCVHMLFLLGTSALFVRSV
jgi:hypothetical protein